jgi:hypothetical protein
VEAEQSIFVASIIGQAGFGPSLLPRIRYAAVERGLELVCKFAANHHGSIHMPRIGTGQSGGSWDTIEEIVRDTLVDQGIPVTVYDPPPRRLSTGSGLFD